MTRRNERAADSPAEAVSRGVSRRALIKGAAALVGGSVAASVLPPAAKASTWLKSQRGSDGGLNTEWIVTTQTSPWQARNRIALSLGPSEADVTVRLDRPHQTIDGFGACFNELGWTSLAALGHDDRESVVRELFAPDAGANFTLCRMPLGANDFSRDWYSYDEMSDDFALEHFDISNDLETLVPFIKNAQRYQPALRLWASPWSPPTWMKTNKHYAAALPPPGVTTGLRPDQVGREGTDMFIQEDRYFRAYAAYFGRFIDEYRKQAIAVGMVMPQNEFNSAQVFPSCTWTAEGLARFIGYLGPEMAKRDVAVFFGTMERPDERLVDVSLLDSKAGKYVKGAGFQWAGKRAIPGIHRRHPGLKLYQTEQECGDGKNDWRYCRYAWTLMRHYLGSGASAYLYWNMVLKRGGVSRWGWAQNSLVTVDTVAKTFTYNHEYYLMKHLSHFVRPGAVRLETISWTGYENLLAFENPDRGVVVVLQNDLGQDLPIRVRIGAGVIAATLPADSFNTFAVRALVA